MRARTLALAMVLLVPSRAMAEWQFKPFAGATFGGSTTFVNVDLDHVAGQPKLNFGVSGLLLGEVIGIEGDVAQARGFFNGGHLVVASGVTTVTGSIVVAAPRRATRYTLRPYVVGGVGLMRVSSEDFAQALPVSSNLATVDVGGGATGFLTDRVGLNWDVRYFHSFAGTDQNISLTNGQPEELSFWRVTMGFVIRY